MKLFFREVGEGDPLIILHGLLGMSDNWLSIGRELADSHRVMMLDLRNHGRSPHHREFGYPLMAEDVNEFMLDHELTSATLLGHSLGGKAAMVFAESYPAKVEKLIVVDVAPKSYPVPEFKEILTILQELDLSTISSRKEAEERLADDIPEPALRKFLLKNLRRDKNNTFSWKMNLPVLQRDIPEIAGTARGDRRYEKPVLFIRGGDSPYILPEDESAIRERFPGTSLVTVPDAGHWVHADNSREFLRAVREFLHT